MEQLGDLLKSADWKAEKHVPVIECRDTVKSGEIFPVKVVLGKEITHPNTTAHHIRWISIYFLPDGGKFPYQISHNEFTAHGESTEGADTSTVYTHHSCEISMKTEKSGTLYAMASCNIHGLWQSVKKIQVK